MRKMPEQNLQININVKGDAATKIKGVDNALKALNDKVGTLNSSNLPALSQNLHGLASALRELSGVNGANIYALGKQINHMLVTLGRLDVSKYSANIEKTTNEVAKMSQKFANFSGSAEKMTEGAHGLAKLPEIFNSLDQIKPDKLESLGQTMTTLANFTGKAAKNGAGIKALAEGIEKLPSALNHFAKLPSDGYSGAIGNLQSVIDQMQKLSVKGGSSLNSAAGGIKKLPEALREFGEASQYSKGIEQVAIALQMLAPALESVYKYGNGIKGVADGLDKLPRALRGFAEADNYTANISKLGETLGQLSTTFNTFDKETTRMVEKGVGKNLREVEKDTTSGFKSLVSAISRLQKMGDENIDEKLNRVAESVKKFVISLESITDEQAQKVYNLGVGLKDLVDASKGLEDAQERLEKMGSVDWASILKSALKKLGSELKKVPKRVMTAVKWLGKLVAVPFKPIVNAVNKITESFKRMFHSVARIAMYRLIRSGLKMVTQGAKEGMDNLYKWAQIVGDDFAPTMDHLASEFLYLKNSVGAAISPVIQALEPLVQNLIRQFVELLNVFNQFIAMASGASEYRRAIYYATTYGDQLEDSLTGAGKAAKELENILMDFDELNLITTPKDRSKSGGDDDELDYGLMFEKVPVDESLFGWLDDIDWTGLGQKFSDKIATMLNSIDWDRIKSKTKSLAKKLASFLNGIFTNKNLFTSLGTSLAEALNTASIFTNDFFGNIDWTALGENFAEGFKKFLKTFNPKEFGKAITAWLKAIADTIHGFVSNMSKEDWQYFADELYVVFSTAVQQIPWETAIPDLVELATGLINAIVAAIKGLTTAKDKIKKGLENADWDGLASSIGALIKEFMPVISIAVGLAITATVASVAVSAGTKVLAGKLFANEVAKALGGTLTTGAAAGATGATGAAGAAVGGGTGIGAIATAALPYIAVGIGVILAIKDAKLKTERLQALVDPASLAVDKLQGVLDGTDLSQSVTEDMIRGTISAMDEYDEKLNSLYTAASQNPKQFGWKDVDEAADALYALQEMLHGTDRLNIGRAGYFIDQLMAKLPGKELVDSMGDRFPNLVTKPLEEQNGLLSMQARQLESAKNKLGGLLDKYSSAAKVFNKYAGHYDDAKTRYNELLKIKKDLAKEGKELPKELQTEFNDLSDFLSGTTEKTLKSVDDEIFDTIQKISELDPALGQQYADIWRNLKSSLSSTNKTLLDNSNELKQQFPGLVKDSLSGGAEAAGKEGEKAGAAYTTGFKKGAKGAAETKAVDVGHYLNTAVKTGLNQNVADTGTKYASNLGKAIYNGKETLNTAGDKVQRLIQQGVLKDVSDTSDKFVNKLVRFGGGGTNRNALASMGVTLGESSGKGFADGLGNKKQTIEDKGKSLGKAALSGIKDGLGNLDTQAQTWGKHICEGLAKGMKDNAPLVQGAGGGLANDIKSNLAFSEPKEGPLSNFHTYMPDMIDLMVSGIKENQYKVENQMISLAGSMAGVADAMIDPSLYKGNSAATNNMANDLYNANAEERALLRELISAVREQRLMITPSASLGKVVNQSQRLYAGVTG